LIHNNVSYGWSLDIGSEDELRGGGGGGGEVGGGGSEHGL